MKLQFKDQSSELEVEMETGTGKTFVIEIRG